MKSYGWIISRLGLLALIWGSSFILMKRGLFNEAGEAIFSGFEVGFLRICFAGMALAPFAVKGLKNVQRKEWFPLIIAGVVGNGMPAILFATAQTQINSSLAGVLNSLTPFFTLILGVAIFGVSAGLKKYLGVILGLVGACGLILSQSNFQFDISSVGGYSLLVVLACVGYATSVNVIKTYLQNLRPLYITSISFLLMLPFFIIAAIFSDIPQVILANPDAGPALGYIAVLGVIGTAMAVVIFNHVIRETSALTASSVTYLIPIVAVAWGIIDGEKFSWMDLLFAAIIISGVYLVRTKKT
ncbi:MAG: DMT family transporter [Luteibaculum sp.]